MDQRLKEQLTTLVSSNTPEEIVGFIMTQVLKIQMLERKIGKLEAESRSWEKAHQQILMHHVNSTTERD